MKKILFAFILITSLTIAATAQDYQTGIGLRFGRPFGITFKHQLGSNSAFEVILGGNAFGESRGLNITGLYLLHAPAFSIENLQWFYGGGGHLSLYESSFFNNESRFNLGLDGIIGLEYYIGTIPFAVSVDLKPYLNFFRPVGFGFDPALSIRYVIR